MSYLFIYHEYMYNLALLLKGLTLTGMQQVKQTSNSHALTTPYHKFNQDDGKMGKKISLNQQERDRGWIRICPGSAYSLWT